MPTIKFSISLFTSSLLARSVNTDVSSHILIKAVMAYLLVAYAIRTQQQK